MFRGIRLDIQSIRQRDPAARSVLHVLFAYPGVHALCFYRLANRCWRHGLKPVAIFLSYTARWLTGIEIHPAATIGRGFFIDHGHGVVIGETAEIGENVTLYQGVTLGGISLHEGKRHPTLGNGVIIGAGAQVLGPITVGDSARIGANAVVLGDVPAGATMVGIPARAVMPKNPANEPGFAAYGSAGLGKDNDPVMQQIQELMNDIKKLSTRIAVLEDEKNTAPVAGARRGKQSAGDAS